MQSLIQLLGPALEIFHQHAILSVGILLLVGYFLGKLFETIRLPAITGYILAGLVLGNSVTGIIDAQMGTSLSSITEIALGLIALTIGGEFSITKIKQTGLNILVLTLFEAIFAYIFVTSFLILFGVNTPIAFLLGAISAATAPAATVVIIKELRARGKFIDYLYGVVAFDDAMCVILFSITFALVSPALTGVAVKGEIFSSILELALSLVIGITGGFLIHMLTIKKYRINEIMLISLSILFLVSSLSMIFHLSLLIANMAMGATIINLSPKNRRIFTIIEPLTPPIFALFFILAGTQLDISIFANGTVVMLGIIYIASRFMGKFSGITLAGTITKVPKKIRNFLGFCLFPQAGVAIGLALFIQTYQIASSSLPELSIIVNIVLLSVFINELVGPIISKFGLKHGADL
ncbi:MAG: cation:proton antiporter [Spirochaetota bacterium]|nr:MAG: cation:proton antiporter [Spirochaetota bacterium]